MNPQKTASQAASAMYVIASGIQSRNRNPVSCATRSVATAYTPSGKTAPQYNGLYANRRCRAKALHKPSMISIGIHQVAVAQNRIVSPLMKGINSARRGSPPLRISVLPVKAEIAIAPISIQYGGLISEGDKWKNA